MSDWFPIRHVLKLVVALGALLLIMAATQLLGVITPDSDSKNTLDMDEVADLFFPAAPAKAPAVDALVSPSDTTIQNAFDARRSNLQVQGKAVVYRVLPDDLDGSRHQKFLLRLTTGSSLLISHNIDLALRINGIKVGDTVEFYGVYEWNEKGGVVHWTHHDPDRRHTGGWLKHNGNTYE